jgi:uncharacterized protein (TIGR00159 family)
MLLLFSIGFLEITWVDIIDIGLVSYLLYQLYKLMKGSVAVKVFLGFLSIYMSYLLVKAAEMKLLTEILGQFMGVGVIALLILFQQEIRKFLLLIGKTTAFNNESFFKGFPWKREGNSDKQLNTTPIVEAAKTMAGSHTGALIVFGKEADLKFYADSGDEIDAIVSKRLLISIFNKYSPLHDGAVIISKNRLRAARCILPVSENENIPAAFGLRHRAAIGLTETVDAIVLVVSEETGQISLVRNGKLMHNLSAQELRTKLNQFLLADSESDEVDNVETRVEAGSG